ncbi:MAG: thiazole biosynthesis adenylyltransferase ThiF [Phycisphaerales bacterium]|nr:thiazole biosynthesis adenylyltransferase ThiF [Phycisphaerales bacterium]
MPHVSEIPHSRYHRQELLAGIGHRGQSLLSDSHVLIAGCGALGCSSAENLARAGVGTLTIVDRDVVDITNLQRQSLYCESDGTGRVPKAEAAKRRIGAINTGIICHGWVDHLAPDNVRSYLRGVDLVIDGLDNFPTRYLLNDACVEAGIPLIYGGSIATRGMSMPILPGETCLRCAFPWSNSPTASTLGENETCDTAGILMSAVVMVSAHQCVQAIKWLTGNREAIDRSLWSFDCWTNRTTRMPLASARQPQCPCCNQRQFDFLGGSLDCDAQILCGRNAVQVRPKPQGMRAPLLHLAHLLSAHGTFALRDNLLVGTLAGVHGESGCEIELAVFSDGRAIVRGSTDPILARTLYDRYVGQ